VLRGSARTAALLVASGAVLLAAGCHSGQPTPVGLALQREDLALTARALRGAEPAIEREGSAAKASWPLIVNGVPALVGAPMLARIHETAVLAAALPLPAPFGEETARGLTGAAAGLAGNYETFYRLATRGWMLIDYSLDQLARGRSPAASFARSNVALYIESVYDAQFDLAQLGKQLVSGYKRLGGPEAFGSALTEAEVDGLAAVYSEPSFRLEPHVAVRLGS